MENAHITFSIQEYSNRSYFSEYFSKIRMVKTRIYSSMNTVLETVMQYPFVKPYFFRVSVSSHTRPSYS